VRRARILVQRGALALFAFALSGCKSEPPAPAARVESDAELRVQRELAALLRREVDVWLDAARGLAAAAPEPRAGGWSEQDRPAIEAMKRHWGSGRVAYEHIEGAVAPLFPESDTATDARYDDFLLRLGETGDSNPFDARGVIGMHAIERVLWADAIPAEVVRFERVLPGYRAAAFPGNEVEARAFREQLVAQLISDIGTLRTQLASVELDLAFAFRGLIDLASEQAEKVDRAATGQEESRYAQATMRDLRANHRGCRDAYELFRPWLLARPDGSARDAAVLAAFTRLESAYAAVSGDAIPRPPRTWSSLDPELNDVTSDFGKLFVAVRSETDARLEGSLHHSLLAAARSLGMPDPVTR
jgi:iron uptake system component EfeO